ncbi:MAG: hypothetical protein ACI39H_04620 [Lachnospiraceae bacterium]
MKRILCCMLVAVMLVATFSAVPATKTVAATKASLKKKLQATTSSPIREFIYEDLNKDGKKEAIAVTSENEDDSCYINATIWYITDESCEASLYNDSFYDITYDVYKETLSLYSVKNTCIFTFETTLKCGNGANFFYAYCFDKKGPKVVENAGVELKYLGNNKFVVIDSRYDYGTDGCGHTWNRYYSKWDGSKLVEYGGLKISQAQLKKAKNGSTILKQIKKQGKIRNIYYRENGLIFVNYRSEEYNYNVALKLKNGKVSYYDQGGEGKTKREKATREGVIHKSITYCVKYPKRFPIK